MAVNREEISVALGVDQSSWKSGLMSASDKAKEFGRGIKEQFKEIGTHIVAGFALGALEQKFDSVLNSVERLSNRARALSVSTSFIQDIENVGKAAGIGQEAIEKMLGKFTQSLPAGSNVESAFFAFSDRLASIPDPAERARMAVEKFGKAGIDMLAIVGNGSAKLREMADSFSKLSQSEIEVLLATDDARDSAENFMRTFSARAFGGISIAVQGVANAWRNVRDSLSHGDMLGALGQFGGIKGMFQAYDEAIASGRAKEKRLEDERLAASVEASKKKYDADMALFKEYYKKREEFLIKYESTQKQLQYYNGLLREQFVYNLAKNEYADMVKHQEKRLEYEGKVIELQKKSAEEKKDAEKKELARQAHITDLKEGLSGQFLPTLDELAQSGKWVENSLNEGYGTHFQQGRFAQDAQRLKFLQGDAHDATLNDDMGRRSRDMSEIAKIESKLEAAGVLKKDPWVDLYLELQKLTAPLEKGGIPVKAVTGK